jgi:hypothetical protein
MIASAGYAYFHFASILMLAAVPGAEALAENSPSASTVRTLARADLPPSSDRQRSESCAPGRMLESALPAAPRIT